MKKNINFVLNALPFFIWIVWFVLALNNIKINPDLGMFQILLLFGLPLLYSILNTVFANNRREFVIYNAIFAVSQVVGYYFIGLLYYDYISSDSETILVRNIFTGISVLYISIITLIFYGIRAIVYKFKIKQ